METYDEFKSRTTTIKVKKLRDNAVLPVKSHSEDAGFDLTASTVEHKAYPHSQVIYGTGLAISIPENHVGLLFQRSSVRKYDLSLSNAVGVLDSGYTGEVSFTFNDISDGESHHTTKMYKVGDRIGQLIVVPLSQFNIEEVDSLEDSERGTGGFGSSGE